VYLLSPYGLRLEKPYVHLFEFLRQYHQKMVEVEMKMRVLQCKTEHGQSLL